MAMVYPKKILHWIDNQERPSESNQFFVKSNPSTEEDLAEVAKGNQADVDIAMKSAMRAYEAWSGTAIAKRAEILKRAALLIKQRREEIAAIIAEESGKPKKFALGEVDAASMCGSYLTEQLDQFDPELFVSSNPKRSLYLIRQSIGVGALIAPFNNPMAGVAWKCFPALLSGNTVVLKSHELTPYIAILFGQIFKEAGLPNGVYSAIQGMGADVGAPIIDHPTVRFISFTGSVATGQKILSAGASRLLKISIESGGKNPFVVCDDADLARAANMAVSSAFVDAGQRCVATSRIIIMDKVFDEFKKLFLERVSALRVGTEENDDYGAIISVQRMQEICSAIDGAVLRGVKILAGGHRIKRKGYFIEPTVLEGASSQDPLSRTEIFGPVVALYRAKDFSDAVALANDSDFKLSGAIHTRSKETAQKFVDQYVAGVVRINGPTYGSEPHVPFGGVGISGNGWREPGIKSLDFYSDWKQISTDI